MTFYLFQDEKMGRPFFTVPFVALSLESQVGHLRRIFLLNSWLKSSVKRFSDVWTLKIKLFLFQIHKKFY